MCCSLRSSLRIQTALAAEVHNPNHPRHIRQSFVGKLLTPSVPFANDLPCSLAHAALITGYDNKEFTW
jgi:hypothetical protein